MFQFIKRSFHTILSSLIRYLLLSILFIWSIISNKNSWSGLFPTLILAVAAWYGLNQTQSQLRLLQEQMTYTRQTVLHFIPRLSDDHTCNLYIANIGNDTVRNVNVRLGLFIVTQTGVYSYGDLQWPPVMTGFRNRTPARESMFPNLTLAPNQEMDLTDRLHSLQYEPGAQFFYSLSKSRENKEVTVPEVTREMRTIKELLNGDYILYAECSWRRKTDFTKYADTTYFSYQLPLPEFITDLRLDVGGDQIIDRVKSYMQHGPKLSVLIMPDAYEIYKERIGSYPLRTKIILRKNSAKEPSSTTPQ